MIVLLLWAAGFAALAYEAAQHGAFRLVSQSLWAAGLLVWAVAGAAICRRVILRPRLGPPSQEQWKKAIREAAAHEERKRQEKDLS